MMICEQSTASALIHHRAAVTRCLAAGVLASVMLLSPVRAADPEFQQAMATAVRAAADHVLPSVVMIEIVGTSEGGQGEVEQDAPTSGVIVDVDGDQVYVIASQIVAMKPAASILVVLGNGQRETAQVVAKDQHRDLVLLKFKSSAPVAAIKLDSGAAGTVGQTTIAVGRYGADVSPMVSTGILSAQGRLDGIALQTDARVSASLYGGALIDLYGNVLGVIIPAVAEGGAENPTDWYDSGIAFAIPTEVIAAKLDRLKAGQTIQKGLLGIVSTSQDLNDTGTEIAAVRSRSPAEAAGIRAGDRVTAVNQISVQRHQQIRQVLGSFDAGETVQIGIDRDGQSMNFDVTLADTIPPLQPQRLGIVANQTADSAVVVSGILPGSPAAKVLELDDVILQIGDAEIASTDALRHQMISAVPDTAIPIRFRRGDETLDASVTPESIAGKMRNQSPAGWDSNDDRWIDAEMKLPESGNVAHFVAPRLSQDGDQEGGDQEGGDQESVRDLGLMILLLGPGEGTPAGAVQKWQAAAERSGVVVCAIAPEDQGKWQPKELEIVANFAAAMMKKAPIHPKAVAVGAAGAVSGADATAADSMALAASISQSKVFFGVAISAKTRPPAVRMRENEPSASLQMMMPVDEPTDLPGWAQTIEKAGYPIIRGGGVDQAGVLAWVRRLQAI
ncbi:Periplasmic serine endoprotease DegP precursor [Rubripirellula lacrimiformis]|uniref:Periplasmic serine endoprotease DegP n=1 Tax=Rubripirellula lacrimiformis TaxID=1930273 RepID=A0A517NG88_9BACT|nr:PDZ domain-containing protein [Rubripirellula lacrimiformis]QDT06093.1 Periplasmic serine endoprotease DegP precursor [Rubripirellula lacrimiformis]